MVLDQLEIAPQIVTITYAALLGMLALAGALAFGLGGREVAAEMLRGAYQAGQENKEQVKQDIQTGKERGQDQAHRWAPRVVPTAASTTGHQTRMTRRAAEIGRPSSLRHPPSGGIRANRSLSMRAVAPQIRCSPIT